MATPTPECPLPLMLWLLPKIVKVEFVPRISPRSTLRSTSPVAEKARVGVVSATASGKP